MAATRKLQSEVEKVYRKVEEGVEIFDTIWDKVYSSTQQSQKEKYEADLKKEIKKLQRLRDQIKGWISQDSIKDKTQLIETRKLIESKMEQFKVCEKETKTKAYSKEGLAREEKLDPREADKEEKRVWINSIVEQLNELVESLEADMEKLSNSKKDKRQKDQLERLGSRIEKNRWHILRLEQINRLLDNDSIEPSQIDSIREDIEYYAECAKEDDTAVGMDDEYNIYEELQLDTIPMDRVVPDLKDSGIATGDDEAEADVKDLHDGSTMLQKFGNTFVEKSKKKTSSSSNPIAAIATIVSGKPIRKTVESEAVKAPTPAKKDTKPNAPAKPATAVIPSKVSEKDKKTAKTENVSVTPASSWASAAASAPVSMSQQSNVGTVSSSAAQPATSSSAPVAASSSSTAPSPTLASPSSAPVASAPVPVTTNSLNATPSTAVSTAHPAQVTSQSTASPTAPLSPQQHESSTPVLNDGPVLASLTVPAVSSKEPVSSSSVVEDEQLRSPYMLPVAPITTETLPPIGSRNSGYTHEMQIVSNMLRMSMMHAPPIDLGDRNRGYVPRNQYPTHPTFPVHPPAILDNPALFERLPMDTLFLSFYYQQGSYQQVLAAKQLKKHSWRFHKKYMTWFQRHEEPKVTTDDYEEGTYVYFDYESGWCQRIKTEFKFEYLYLEDELSVGPS